MEKVTDFIFLGSKITVDNDCRHEMKTLAHWKENYDKSRQHIKKQRHHFVTKAPLVKAMVFSSSHIQMWEWDHKEGWEPKNWCFQIVELEKSLESPLDCKEIQPVHPKGNQPWICIGRTDTEAEAPILWLPDPKRWLIGKDPDSGKDWGQEEKGATEDDMVGWHHWLNGHEFKETPGPSEGQARLVCRSPWGHKESDTTEQLNNNKSLKKLRRYCMSQLSTHPVNESTYNASGTKILSIWNWS